MSPELGIVMSKKSLGERVNYESVHESPILFF